MKEDKIVLIKVKAKTRERLKAAKRGGETYEDVISSMFSALETREGEVR